jgi:hypothetical protein
MVRFLATRVYTMRSSAAAFAAEQDRVLVTSDLKTMPGHFDDFIVTHGFCPGVFLVKQRHGWEM